MTVHWFMGNMGGVTEYLAANEPASKYAWKHRLNYWFGTNEGLMRVHCDPEDGMMTAPTWYDLPANWTV